MKNKLNQKEKTPDTTKPSRKNRWPLIILLISLSIIILTVLTIVGIFLLLQKGRGENNEDNSGATTQEGH